MKFNSTDLQNAFDNAKPILDQVNQIKDTISNEIKALEKYLQSINLGEDFTYYIQNPQEGSSFIETEIGEYSLSGWALTREELLIWDNQQKRLMYQLNHYNADIDIESPVQVTVQKDSCQIVIKKPLIECAFDIRKQVYEDCLSKFLTMIAQKFIPKPKVEALISSDVTF